MARKKVKLAYIENDTARKATFGKRKTGLLKKLYELKTLCDVDACAIMYSPYEPNPEVWPNEEEAKKVLAKFKNLPDAEKSKKMMNQEEFIKQRIEKEMEQLRKLQAENREKEMSRVMYQCLAGKGRVESMSKVDLMDLGWWIDRKLEEIRRRREELTRDVAAPEEVAEEIVPMVVEGQGGGLYPVCIEQPMPGHPFFTYLLMVNAQDHVGGFGGSGGGSGDDTVGNVSNMPKIE